jgi:hypothetical protein
MSTTILIQGLIFIHRLIKCWLARRIVARRVKIIIYVDESISLCFIVQFDLSNKLTIEN